MASACRSGNGADCRLAAEKLISVSDVKRHPNYCVLLNHGCLASDTKACELLTERCADTFASYGDRLQEAESGCREGSADSCRDAGRLYEGATGVAPDRQRALGYYERGCNNGDLVSCLGQARLLANPKAAAELLGRECRRPLPGACLALGHAHAAGDIVARDTRRAGAAFTMACQQDQSMGCLEFARIIKAEGKAKPAEVAAAFRKGCDAGNSDACREGLRVSGLAAADLRYFREQLCFHEADDGCARLQPQGVALSRRTIDLARNDPKHAEESVAFVGPNGHSLLAVRGAKVTLARLDGTVVGTHDLASERIPHPRPFDRPLQRTLTSGDWGWDDERGLFGVVVVGGIGVPQHEVGPALWAPARENSPTLLRRLKKDSRVVAASLSRGVVALGNGEALEFFDLRGHALQGGTLAGALAGAPPGVSKASFSARGDVIAFAGDGWIGFVDGSRPLVKLPGGPRYTSRIALNPIRPELYAADFEGRLYAWNLEKPKASPRRSPSLGSSFLLSPDGRLLVVIGETELIALNPATWGRVAAPIALRGEFGGAAAFSPDARYLAVADSQGLTLVDFASHKAAPAIDDRWFAKLRRLPPPPAPQEPAFTHGATISGIVLLENKPLANAEVVMRPSSDEWPKARALPPKRTRTDREGKFAFPAVASIGWEISVKGSPTTTRIVEKLELRGERKTADRGYYSLQAAHEVRGTVVGPSGLPVAGARLNGELDEVVSDKRGRFAIPHVHPGKRVIMARADDGSAGSASADVGSDKPIQIRLAPAGDPKVLRVKAVDEFGSPIASAMVRANGSPAGMTDQRGETAFHIEGRAVEVDVYWRGRVAGKRVRMPHSGLLVVALEPR